VLRGHLERPGHQVVNGLEDVVVMVKKVVHAQKFDPAATKPETLEYFLFGKDGELFLAHAITEPPDFDQIVSVNVSDHSFTDQELNRGDKRPFSGPAQRGASAAEGKPAGAGTLSGNRRQSRLRLSGSGRHRVLL